MRPAYSPAWSLGNAPDSRAARAACSRGTRAIARVRSDAASVKCACRRARPTALPGSGSNAEAEADTFLRLEDLWQSHRGTLATRQTSGQLALRAPELTVPPRRREWRSGSTRAIWRDIVGVECISATASVNPATIRRPYDNWRSPDADCTARDAQCNSGRFAETPHDQRSRINSGALFRRSRMGARAGTVSQFHRGTEPIIDSRIAGARVCPGRN
jgi:hypothetical protein